MHNDHEDRSHSLSRESLTGSVSRRSVLRAAVVGAASAGIAGSILLPASPAAAATASYSKVGSASLRYEDSGAFQSFTFETGFHNLCDSWFGQYAVSTPNAWTSPWEVWTNGVYVNKAGMHGLGRAIDVSRIYSTVSGTNTLTFDARYNIWGAWAEGSAKDTKRKRYWAGVATLNYYFTPVLHYLYNADHHNHVHADNEGSGSGWGTFSTGRRSQVLSTQACLRYIWGYSTSIDGVWGSQTDGHSRDVLAKSGTGGALTSGASYWRTFNHLAARWGNGTQTSW